MRLDTRSFLERGQDAFRPTTGVVPGQSLEHPKSVKSRPRNYFASRYIPGGRVLPGMSLSRPPSAPPGPSTAWQPPTQQTTSDGGGATLLSPRLANRLRINVQVSTPDANRVWSHRHHVPRSSHNEVVNFRQRAYFDKKPLIRGLDHELTDKELLYHGLKKAFKQRQLAKSQNVKDESNDAAKHGSSDRTGSHEIKEGGGAAGDSSAASSADAGEQGDHEGGSSPKRHGAAETKRFRGNMKKRQSFKRAETDALKAAYGNADVVEFYDWLIKAFGNLTRGWRMLDKTLNMKLTLLEFLTGCRAYKFDGDARTVFKELDRDNTGNIQYYHFDPSGAIELSQLTAWCEQMGGVEKLFHVLDKDRNGKLSPEEFIRGAKQNGLPSAEPVSVLFQMLDLDKSKTLDREELRFLEEWPCPPFLKVKPDYHGRSEFREALLQLFHGNGIRAWRKAIDLEGLMEVDWDTFIRHISKVGKLSSWTERYPAVFRAYDENLSGYLTLRAFDPETYRLLLLFKTHCIASFGGVLDIFHSGIDIDGRVSLLTKREFTLATCEMPFSEDERELLFKGLDLDGKGTIKPSELRWLNHWNHLRDRQEDIKWQSLCQFQNIPSSDADSPMPDSSKVEKVQPRSSMDILKDAHPWLCLEKDEIGKIDSSSNDLHPLAMGSLLGGSEKMEDNQASQLTSESSSPGESKNPHQHPCKSLTNNTSILDTVVEDL